MAQAPVFVFLHGGYWRGGSAAMHSWIAAGLQPRGVTTVIVDYALCPAVRIDEITRQVRGAIEWVVRHIGAHGADPARIGVGGHSAGAHLAALCLQTHSLLRSGLLLSGIYDLAPLRHSFLQPDLQLDEPVIQACSPVLGVRPCPARLWIGWGSAETAEFARQSARFHQAWQSAGNTSELKPVAGANHYSVLEPLAEPDSDLCRWVSKSL